jgi:hypothetical protein
MLEEDVANAIAALNAPGRKSGGKVLLTDTFGVQREVNLDAEEDEDEDDDNDGVDRQDHDEVDGLDEDLADAEKKLAAQKLEDFDPMIEVGKVGKTLDEKEPSAATSVTSPTADISTAPSLNVSGFLNSFTPSTIASSAVKDLDDKNDESQSDADDDSVEYLKQIVAQTDGAPEEDEDEDEDDDDNDDDDDGDLPMGTSSYVGTNGERFASFNLKIIFPPFRTGSGNK